ncbi:hypothetical protein [Azotobacter vinelandii]
MSASHPSSPERSPRAGTPPAIRALARLASLPPRMNVKRPEVATTQSFARLETTPNDTREAPMSEKHND